ncbi:hypothetical protein BJV82DRAFT_607841 [Fennellomyces sp. T-0311]|nr:hypothetical protein BJV82DRAFT_607841 [Fennellomyces sp. T-0311]
MVIDMLEVPSEEPEAERVVVESKQEEEPSQDDEATVRREAIYLHGLDEMSTKDINAYCTDLDVKKVEWINDSSCNLVFEDEETANKAISSLLRSDPEDPVTHRVLRKARAYTQESSGHVFDNLHIRVATTQDIKEPGARDKSRYYLLHGEEQRRNNGSVFDRLGKRNENRPTRRRPQERRRSLSPQPIRADIKIPDRLKGRIGARRPR